MELAVERRVNPGAATISTPHKILGRTERINRRFDNAAVPYFLVVLAFWIVCLVEWTQKFAGQTPSPWFWFALSIAVTVFAGVQTFRLHPQLRQVRVGEQNAGNVAEVLDQLKTKGCIVFHHRPAERGNVDFVVVSTGGVFVLKTKRRSGSGLIDYRDDETLIVGRVNEAPALRQARDAARSVGLQVQEQRWVKPLIVFVGDWQVQREAGDFAVDVVTLDGLQRYFERQQPELTRGEIEAIALHLEPAARS